MKPLLPSFVFAVILFSFSSCIKTYEAPPPPPVDPLVGSWYLYDASELDGSSWYAFNAGINGVFSFYQNGTAQYDNGNVLMQGNWTTTEASDGYYDAYGNYYTNAHETFQTSLSANTNSSLYLYFDDISFSDNDQFTGTYYTGKTIERYTFRRNN